MEDKGIQWYCNTVYNQNIIDIWTKGCILPFLKKGDLGIAKNYRGITLISIMAKIYNALLRNRIEPSYKFSLSNWKITFDYIIAVVISVYVFKNKNCWDNYWWNWDVTWKWSLLYDAGQTFSKYTSKTLKIICNILVMLISLMCSFHIWEQTYWTEFLCVIYNLIIIRIYFV